MTTSPPSPRSRVSFPPRTLRPILPLLTPLLLLLPTLPPPLLASRPPLSSGCAFVPPPTRRAGPMRSAARRRRAAGAGRRPSLLPTVRGGGGAGPDLGGDVDPDPRPPAGERGADDDDDAAVSSEYGVGFDSGASDGGGDGDGDASSGSAEGEYDGGDDSAVDRSDSATTASSSSPESDAEVDASSYGDHEDDPTAGAESGVVDAADGDEGGGTTSADSEGDGTTSADSGGGTPTIAEAEVVDGPWADTAASLARRMRPPGSASPASASSSSSSSTSPPSSSSVDPDQERYYALSAALWLALALDALLNKSKRAALFAFTPYASPGGTITARNAGPTAALASGFVLASGVAAVLSRSLRDGAEGEGEEEGSGVVVVSAFRRTARRRLALSLAAFGALNVGASCGNRAFLGLSAGAVGGYNAVLAASGWVRDARRGAGGGGGGGGGGAVGVLTSLAAELWGDARAAAVAAAGGESAELLRAGTGRRRRRRLRTVGSAAYLLAALSAALRAARVGRELALAKSGPTPSNMISGMVSPLASLSRFILTTGVALTLKDALDRDQMGDPIAVALNGLASVCSLAIAAPLLIVNEGMRSLTSDAGKLLLLGLFTGFHCMSQLVTGRKFHGR